LCSGYTFCLYLLQVRWSVSAKVLPWTVVNFDIASACIDIPIRFHFTLFTQQFKIQMQRVQYATYNSLEGCSKARSALTNAPSNEKEKNKWE